jgi:uncharacterized protein (TIGR02147 family)
MTREGARALPKEPYRVFLERRLALEKESNPQFTSARLAQELGLSAAGLSMRLSGKRNLQMSTLLKLARALKWDEYETDLFEAMVRRDDATSSEERAYFEVRLERLSKTPARDSDSDHVQGFAERHRHISVDLPSASLLDKWYYPAVVVYLLDAQGSHPGDLKSLTKDVAARFDIPMPEASAILAHMKELGLLDLGEESGKGRLHIHLARPPIRSASAITYAQS